MAFLNQFSFMLIAGMLMLLLMVFLSKRGSAEGGLMTVLALLVGLTFAFVFFRPIETEGITSQSFDETINTDSAVLLEFQSPYCAGCMAAEPIVKQIEFDFAGELDVIRVNVLEEGVDPLLKRYQFQYTPTFIFLDGQGHEVWRTVGILDPEQVRMTMEDMQ
jgi:thiol-disulfide isomerase/thioredoxin